MKIFIVALLLAIGYAQTGSPPRLQPIQVVDFATPPPLKPLTPSPPQLQPINVVQFPTPPAAQPKPLLPRPPLPIRPLPFPPIVPIDPIIDLPPPCGLLTVNNTHVPLKQIAIEANVYGFFADVSTNLTYVNEYDEPLEVQFVFPLDAKSALYNMTSHCAHTITGEIKEKKQAEIEYQDAIDAGKQASLLEEDDRHSDVLTLKLGNIKPGEVCWVHFAFVNDLELSQDKPELSFTYPIILGERYNADPENGDEITSGYMTPRENAEDLPYTYTFDFNVIEPHEVQLEAQGDLQWDPSSGEGPKGLSLQPGQSLDRNVHIIVKHKRLEPFQYVEVGKKQGDCFDQKWQKGEFTNFLGDTVAMLNYLPDFSDESLVDQGQEYVIILDRSGSMTGDRIDQARLTLGKFLDNLPKENSRCRFNILSFGTEHEFMFSESVPCTKTNIANAKEEVKTFDADMGGTEMLRTFEDLFKQDKAVPNGVQRQVFLLTDGEVSNTQEVIDLVGEHSEKNRIFSFGIGEGVSTELVDGVASFGGASRILKSGEEQEELNQHVLRALKASQSSYFFDLDVDLAMADEGICGRVTSMSNTIFPGEFFEVFVVIRGELPRNGYLGKAILTGKTFSAADKAGKRTVIPKTFEFAMHIFNGVDTDSLPVHRVAAKRIISALKLNKDNLPHDQKDQQMLVVSEASNVLSPVTALIAVDHDAPAVNETAKKVFVPVAAEESMMDMAMYSFAAPVAVGGYGGSYNPRSLPMMPMAPPMPVPSGGGYAANKVVAPGGAGDPSWSPMPGMGVPGTNGAGFTPKTTTSFPLYPPEYKVHFDGECVELKLVKQFEATTTDICAALVDNDNECSNYFQYNSVSQDCGCMRNPDDRFKKAPVADCSVYRIPPSAWLNKAGKSQDLNNAPKTWLLISVLSIGLLVGLIFGVLCGRKRQPVDEDHYIHLDVARNI